jgi:hypothetical protein
VNRYRRAGVSALTTLPHWRIGVVALVHVGIAALRLGIAALARRERARNGGALVYLMLSICNENKQAYSA